MGGLQTKDKLVLTSVAPRRYCIYCDDDEGDLREPTKTICFALFAYTV